MAVTISRRQEASLPLGSKLKWYCFTEDEEAPDLPEQDYQRIRGLEPRRYVNYLATKRNRAVQLALERHPDAESVLICDSYYLPQRGALRKLLDDYRQARNNGYSIALGGAIWGRIRMELKDWFRFKQIEWFDKWAVPELRWTPYGWLPEKDLRLARIFQRPMKGLYRVSSLGGIAVWPRSVWDHGCRFVVPDDLHGCELNGFYESLPLPRFVDLNAIFWRKLQRPFLKCLRVSLHLGRFTGRKS